MSTIPGGLFPGLCLAALLGACAAAPGTAQDTQRYRGDYTLGHEVNSFCPRCSRTML